MLVRSDNFSLEEELCCRLGLRVEVDGVHADTLGLEGHDGVDLLVGGVGSGRRATDRGPGELFLGHLFVVLVVRQGSLHDLDASLLACILGSEEVMSVLLQIEHRGLSRGSVEEVSHVLDANKNLVSVHREEVDLEVAIEVSNWSGGAKGSFSFRKLFTLSLGNEEGNRFVDRELHLTLR